MAMETRPEEPEAAPAKEVVVAEVLSAEEEVVDKETSQEPAIQAQTPGKKPALEAALAAEAAEEAGEKKAAVQEVEAKESSVVAADREDPEKKALDELKQLVRAALANREFSPPPPPAPATADAAVAPTEEHTSKAEEAKAEEETAATAVVEPPKAVVEESAPSIKEEEAEAPAPTLPTTEENAIAVDDDGAKTVEAIEETVVPVAAPPPEVDDAPAAESPKKEKENEKATAPAAVAPSLPPAEEIFIWGVPLLGDERSDTVLLKFLRARDFKVKEAMTMLKNAVLWRKEFGIEELLNEDLGIPEMEKVVFMHGIDKEGHPVCYNVYGEFQNKELYAAAFADEEKRKQFLRWRIQYLEKGIRNMLDFNPGGVSTMVQVTDLKNSIGLAKKELRQALDLLQDNYPEFAAKQLNLTATSSFLFCCAFGSARYIAPEQVPVQFGGLSKENDPDFSTADAVTEITIKPSTKQAIEISVTEPCLLVWELRVLGWDVSYGAEFVPVAEDGYTVIVQKARKLVAVVKDSFKIGDAGKVVLTVNNTSSKKKRLLYRYKTKSSTDSI
ncbi:hypothetical protein BHE74_00042280 [Ensete ventricosum]|nr:hypothetical protein GW17_00029900 [Ensete ventricosum]RWW51380.1 hypothetical protein BHE74_00042280 [Ensete ventricosum]RZS20292.1 hypothetical protein BHM03_00052801 [Ensete ventricosum]